MKGWEEAKLVISLNIFLDKSTQQSKQCVKEQQLLAGQMGG